MIFFVKIAKINYFKNKYFKIHIFYSLVLTGDALKNGFAMLIQFMYDLSLRDYSEKFTNDLRITWHFRSIKDPSWLNLYHVCFSLPLVCDFSVGYVWRVTQLWDFSEYPLATTCKEDEHTRLIFLQFSQPGDGGCGSVVSVGILFIFSGFPNIFLFWCLG